MQERSARPRIVSLIFFLGVFSIVIYVANLVAYEALAAIFNIFGTTELIALGTILGLLSGGFIAVSILGTRYYNFFTRGLYRVTAVWMGFFLYLFFTSVVYGLLTMLAIPNAHYLGMALLAAAAIATVYGFFHARDIRVVEKQITLPNLPAAWRGRKLLFVSDLHLGQLHGPAFTRKVVVKANSFPHDLVCIGGDLFDGTGAPDIAELVAPLRDLRAPLGVFFITGNHEEFGDSGRFLDAVRSVGARTLVDESIDLDGVQLIGVDYAHATHADAFREILSRLKIDRTLPSILLKHEPKDLDVARDAGISLQLSGHTHRAQQWPLTYIAQLVYKGHAYGLTTLQDLQIYVSSGVGTWGPPIRVGTDSEIVVITFM